MKVPLVIRAPQLKPGTENRLAQHVDIAPSIVGLLGLPAHPSFQGIDLLNTAPDPKRSAYMVAQTPLAYQYGIVRSGHKLIYDEREPRYLLYDLVPTPARKPILGLQSRLWSRTWRSGCKPGARCRSSIMPTSHCRLESTHPFLPTELSGLSISACI